MHYVQYYIDIKIIFFINDTATTEIYTLSLHDALPICRSARRRCPPPRRASSRSGPTGAPRRNPTACCAAPFHLSSRSEEHTSELQSRQYLVCCLLLENTR